jgi:RNA polymerase sigma factor (sigma-70 family)
MLLLRPPGRLHEWMERKRFDSTVSRYSRRVFTFASYLLVDPGEAEDITQDVLIKLWKSGGEIDPDRLGAWLLTVTRNACTDVLRRRRRTAEIIPIRRETHPPTDHPSSAPGPERVAAGSQLGEKILKALNELSERARTVVIMREIQGLSYREISDVTEIHIDTVRVILHRARRRLRESLKEVQPHVVNS